MPGNGTAQPSINGKESIRRGRRAFFARAKSPEASGATTEPDTGVTGARAKLVRATPADLADLLGADPALRDVVRYDTLRRCVDYRSAAMGKRLASVEQCR
jgi:hypothetical protein